MLTFTLQPTPGALFPSGATIDPSTGQFNWTSSEDGIFGVRVVATDNVGVSDHQDVQILISNVAPIVDAGNDVPINEGDTLTRSGSFSDPGADTWTPSSMGLPMLMRP